MLERNTSAVADALLRTLASERWSRKRGLLQSVDPRVKIIVTFCAVLACSLLRSIPLICVLYGAATALAVLSRIGLAEFTRRVWIFIPLFTGLIAVPALFLTKGTPVASLGPLTVTREGTLAATYLVLRVSTSVSLTVLLVLTTPWNRLLRALRELKVPPVLVSLLALCYRYLLLLLRTLSELFTARTSRVMQPLPYKKELGFLSRSAGYLFLRSMHLAEGVYMAMSSRGFPELGAAETRAVDHGRRDREGGARYAAEEGTVTPDEGTVTPDEGTVTPDEGTVTPDGTTVDGETVDGAVPRSSRTREDARGGAAFELRKMRFSYPDGITGVEIGHLDVCAGTCTILLGPNGSGKSTLLRILNGLLFAQEGEVRAFGRPLTENNLGEKRFRRLFRSRIGLVFQDPDIQCFSPTVREELSFGPVQLGLDPPEIERRIEQAMNTMRIASLGERYPYRLSCGEKKRVAIASVLTLDPEILLMDEPTANLDPATEGMLIDLLAGLVEKGRTLVIATQDILLARHIGEQCIILGADKRLTASGPAGELLGNEALLEGSGLAHMHRAPHRRARATVHHTHYTEEERT